MDLAALMDATWPAAEVVERGGWRLRRGDGGGQRVSAATPAAAAAEPEVAEAAMRGWGQRPLFRLGVGDAALGTGEHAPSTGEHALDAVLAGRGYAMHDPSLILAAPVAAEAPDPAAIRCAAPLAIMLEIWATDGIGPGRRAVMERVATPKVWLMGRLGDRPAGCAFVAAAGEAAMLHALVVAPEARRRGLGARLTRAAAAWAAEQGASRLALAVTAGNAPARGLYGGLGFGEVGRYHYRLAPEEDRP